MKLYTNGCSFTYGHAHEPAGLNEIRYKDYVYYVRVIDQRTWSYQLQRDFDVVFNHALGGSGPQRMTRTTLDFIANLDKEELDDWIFVLQYSEPSRQEVLLGEKHTLWTQTHRPNGVPMPSDRLIDVGYDTFGKTWESQEDRNRWEEEIEKYLSDPMYQRAGVEYLFFTQPYRHHLFQQLKEIAFMVHYFELIGVKYLITGMNPMCHSIHDIVETMKKQPDLVNIANTIPTHNFIKAHTELLYPPFDYTDPTGHPSYDVCGHPNKRGHRIIANYIYNEIKQRGWI